LEEDELVRALDEFYGMVHATVRSAGGEVVKTLGDGALVVWPAESADEALEAAFRLREGTKAWAGAHGMDCQLVARLHAGAAALGAFGPEGAEHRDVMGKAVFVAARLEARSISASAEFFRRLSPESRKRLKKHTPPVVYIPSGDPRP
jgi:adenylate cyclase